MKPRLCIFFPSIESGGLERAMMRIAAALVDQGFEVEVVYIRSNREGEQLWDPRVRLTRIRPVWGGGEGGRGGTALAILPGLIALWTRRRPDCVLSVQSSVFCIPLAALFGIPVIHRESSNSLEAMGRHSGVWKRRMVLGAKAVVYRVCACVVANSVGAAASAQTVTGLPASRVRVVPNPVDVDALRRAAEGPVDDAVAAQWLADPSLPVIVWVGRLSWEKDAATMLKAFANIVSLPVAPPVRLVFAGHGRDRAELERLATSLGVWERVRFCGHARNPAALMARADVYALTSLYEGLPNALLEAAALGVPAVSTDCPTGPREILAGGEGGLLVPVGDDAALAQALLQMLTNPAAAQARAQRALQGMHRYHPATVSAAYARIILNAMHESEPS
jgi:glycosyltransferase involved in cell wall biosynthesis